LWAKHGPVWLTPPTADAELTFRRALRSFVASRSPQIAFVRLHAHHEAPDLRPLLQSVTYDETVVVDLTPSEDEIMAAMGKTGRKKLRRTLRDEGFLLTEESDISREGFDELYEIYRETAARDGFGIYPAEVYYSMLTTLGDSARLFVARRSDSPSSDIPSTDGPGDDEPQTPGRAVSGRAVSWVISTFYDGIGQDYYGASNAEGFETNAALRLKWHILMSLKAEGCERYDMMGVGSAKAPQLMGVRQFKMQFADETTQVDPSWDVPVKPWTYRALTAALTAKRALVKLRRRAS
jgi:lipid II:glycine glycyltransferase (peptidoglycan interpeptide bridge formation enzyme)